MPLYARNKKFEGLIKILCSSKIAVCHIRANNIVQYSDLIKLLFNLVPGS